MLNVNKIILSLLILCNISFAQQTKKEIHKLIADKSEVTFSYSDGSKHYSYLSHYSKNDDCTLSLRMHENHEKWWTFTIPLKEIDSTRIKIDGKYIVMHIKNNKKLITCEDSGCKNKTEHSVHIIILDNMKRLQVKKALTDLANQCGL